MSLEIHIFFKALDVCEWFYGLSALVDCWSLVFIRKIFYKCFNVCPFDNTDFAVRWKVGIPSTGLTTLVGLCVIILTDHPTLDRNRCVIEVLGDVFVLTLCFRNFLWVIREKGRDMTQSYDKSPYNHRNIQKAPWQYKNATTNFD